MRAVWCGFALGVIGLQQQAALPGWGAALAPAALACAALAWAWSALRGAAGAGGARNGWLAASGWVAVCLAAACAGFGYAAWRAHLRLAEALPAAWQSRDLDVTGHIAALPAWDATGARFVFRVESWAVPAPAGTRLPATLLLSWVARDAPLPPLAPGARWRLPVRLKRPHGNGNFGLRDAEVALLARGIRASGYVSDPRRAVRFAGEAHGVGVAIERVRAAVRARIEAVLADAPHRGIVVALATGAQDAVSEADWRLMRNTGTSHLVAISGMHLAFVAGLAGWVAGASWRRLRWRGVELPLLMPAQQIAVIGAALAALAYALLAGFNVPVQRALWMLAVTAVALLAGRDLVRSQVLCWALGLVLLRDPWAVTAAGFWLSFGAVAAILYANAGVPRLRRDDVLEPPPDYPDPYGYPHGESSGRTPGAPAADPSCGAPHDASPPRDLRSPAASPRPRPVQRVRRLAARVRDSMRIQWAVTLALAPLSAYWFAQIPLIGPFANAFAIPWVSVLVTPLVLAGVVLPAPLDAFALRAAHALLEGFAAALGPLERLPWAVLHLPQPGPGALAAAVLGVAWCLAPRGWPLRWLAPFTWLPLLVPPPSGPPAGAFRLTALDIGQGTSVLVETARHTLLFDAGPGPESTHAGERVVVPYLQAHGVGRLDTLMISHDDSDHSGGAPAVLAQIGVRQFVAGIAPAHPLWASARKAGARTVRCAAGQRWHWDGVDFEVLWPDPGPLAGKPNAHCCVLRVATAAQDGREAVAALIAADIEARAERTLVARDPRRLRASVLVVPHHGSRTSSTEPFLDSVWPLVALFQVGYLNRFHHPHPAVLARFEARPLVLARSDADGAVRVEARPGALAVERFRDTARRYWMDAP